MTDVQRFELPRDDWYDADGRIYKDVIIENLNACEQKLLEIQGLDAFVVEKPDLDTIVYPDTDLTSEDNCIVNLKSFLDIFNLVYYPIECEVAGITVKKVCYWDDNYSYITIETTTLSDISDSKPFVVVDISNEEVKCISEFNSTDYILIGKYIDGKIVSVYETAPLNVNLLQMLADMKLNVASASGQNGLKQVYINENQVGYIDGESRSATRSATFMNKGE